MSICTGLVIRRGDVGPDRIETRPVAGLALLEIKATPLPFAPPSLVHQVWPVCVRVPHGIPLVVAVHLGTFSHHTQRAWIGGIA